MTYGDILDSIVQDSGDAGTTYRANLIRWLNFARQEAALRGSWKSAKNASSTLTTDIANVTGIYELTGIDEVVGGEMYDLTNNNPIERDTENTIMRMELPLTFGPPVLFADAGQTALGERQIQLWPVPDDVRTIAYIGNKALIDVTAANEAVSIDPYFGALSGCGSMLQAGLRYFHDVNNNEDVATTGRSQSTFYKAISLCSAASGVDANGSSRLEPVNLRRGWARPMGRFDPGHYSNR